MFPKKIANRMIVLACVAVVLLPFLSGLVRHEIANWHIAAAANALEFEEGDWEASLQRAALAGVPLEKQHNYWLFRIDKCAKEDMSLLPRVVSDAIAAGASRVPIMLRALRPLEVQAEKEQQASLKQKDESEPLPLSNPDAENLVLQIGIIEKGLKESELARPELRNKLAYLRALAGTDLDKALEDINYALKRDPKNYAYLDTRAWVYYQRGDIEEALPDATQAVELFQKELGGSNSLFTAVLDYLVEEPREARADASATKEAAVDELKIAPATLMEGVLRYHRAVILDALSKTEESKPDWEWLRERDLPTDGSLQ